MSKQTRVLVAGGSGLIGSHLCKKLLKEGYYVVSLDNYSRGDISFINNSNIDIRKCDITDKNELFNKVLGGGVYDIIVNAAAINGTDNFYKFPKKVLDVGIRGTINLIDYALQYETKKFINISSSEIYNSPTHIPTTEKERMIIPDPHCPRFSYGGGKIASELLTIYSGLNAAIIRPHNIMVKEEINIGGHLIPDILNKILNPQDPKYEDGKLIINIQGTGNESRSFCDIEDFINGFMIVLENTSKEVPIYNIGTENEIKISDLVHMIADILEVKIKIVPGKLTEGSTLRRCPSIDKLRKLGYEPKVGLREGLEKTIKWYKKNYEKIK